MTRSASVLALVLVSASALLNGEATPAKFLLVLSKADKTLSIVDPASLKVIARMPSGNDPHEVVATADGKFAYISNYGGGRYNTITVADLTAQKTIKTIDLGPLRGPHGLMFANGKVWFTAEVAKVIGSIDPKTNEVDWVMGTGQNRTHMIYVIDDKHLVTSNVASATMTFLDKSKGGMGPGGPPPGGPGNGPGGPPPGGPGGPAPGGPMGPPQDNWDLTVVPVGRGAEGFDVTPDKKELWAANAQDGTVSVIDVASKKVTQTLDANVRGANRLKFTPDGKLAFISTLGGSDLVIYDVASRTEKKRIKIGRGAAGIQMVPDGSRVFVACTPDDYVTTVDLKTLEVTGHLDAGKQPDGMDWAVLAQ